MPFNRLFSIILIFHFCFLHNLIYGESILVQTKILPNFTITTDQSAFKHIQEAQVLIDLGEYEKSTTYLNLISQRYKGNNKKVKARILGGLARNYFKLGLNRKAIRVWQDAIQLVENIPNNNYLIGIFNNNMALAFINLEETEKARNCLLKTLDIFPLSQTYEKLSKIALDADSNFELSKMYLDIGLSRIENPIILTQTRLGSSTYFEKLNEANILKGYAYHYFKKADYKTSVEKYEKVLRISKDIKRVELEVEILKKLGYVYQNMGNKEKSNNYFTKYVSVNDSLRAAKNKALPLSLQNFINDKKVNTPKKEPKNKVLKFISLFSIICILVILIFTIRSYINQRKNSKIIKKSNKENQILKKRLDKSFDELVLLAKNNDSSFLAKFKQVYPSLYKKLTSLTTGLTDSEIGLCAMIWLKFSTKEIAQFTFVQHKSVQTKKYRLRKKLSLSKGTDLYEWICNL